MKFTAATIATLAVVVSALPTDVAAPKGETSRPYTYSIRPLTDFDF
jgi:hypothetical protein